MVSRFADELELLATELEELTEDVTELASELLTTDETLELTTELSTEDEVAVDVAAEELRVDETMLDALDGVLFSPPPPLPQAARLAIRHNKRGL